MRVGQVFCGMEALLRASVATTQHLEQVLIVDDTPASSSSHDANAARRQPGPQSSMEDLIAWEEGSVGCLDGGRCARWAVLENVLDYRE